MPYNISQSAQYTEKEILKYPVGLGAKKSVVLDATVFTITDPSTRYIVPAGTILRQVVDKHVPYTGTGLIDGILGRNVDILAAVTAGSEPAPMFFHGCVFNKQSIVAYTTYAAALAAATSGLVACKFE